MGRYVKNKELDSQSYSIRLPMGSNVLAPNDPVTGLIRFNQSRSKIEFYDVNRWRPLTWASDIEYPFKDVFYGTGTQTVFGPMRFKYPVGNEIFLVVHIHNVWQNPGVAYTIDDYTISFSSPVPDGHAIVIVHGLVPGDPFVPIPTSWQPPPQRFQPPSYRIISSSDRAIEVDANLITFTVTTTNVNDGTVLYYRLRPGPVPADPADIAGGGAPFLYTGSFVIQGNIATFDIEIVTDLIVEYDESFYVEVLTGNINGTVVTTSVEYDIVIYEELPKLYSLSQDRYLVNEGSTVNYTMYTNKVPDGSIFWYRVIADPVMPVDGDDFVGGNAANILFGTFTVTSNIGTFSINTRLDSAPDLGERFFVQVREDDEYGRIVANSAITAIGWTFM